MRRQIFSFLQLLTRSEGHGGEAAVEKLDVGSGDVIGSIHRQIEWSWSCNRSLLVPLSSGTEQIILLTLGLHADLILSLYMFAAWVSFLCIVRALKKICFSFYLDK